MIPSWEELLQALSKKTNNSFHYYFSTAEGSYPRMASLISKELNEKWWKDEEFEDSRNVFESSCQYKDSPLKYEAVKLLGDIEKRFKRDEYLEKEIKALKSICVDGIITTNWDSFLEEVFEDYSVYIGQESLLFGDKVPQGIAEIYKIHGCKSNPNSLVFSEEDYSKYDSSNSYLVTKLLTIFVENPIIFMGYSLSDKNIQKIIQQIVLLLDSSALEKLQERFVFVQWNESVESCLIRKHSVTPNAGQHFMCTVIETSNYLPVFEALSGYKRKFPAKILRRLKEQIYNIILTDDAKSNLYVKDFSTSKSGDGVDVVFGIGAINRINNLGYESLDREDLLRDIIYPEKGISSKIGYNPEKVLELVIPKLQGDYFPVFKYLREAKLDAEEKIREANLSRKVLVCARREKENFGVPAYRKHADNSGSLEELYEKYGADVVFYSAAYLSDEKLDELWLLEFIKEKFDVMYSDQSKRTYLAKLICLYDYIKYRM